MFDEVEILSFTNILYFVINITYICSIYRGLELCVYVPTSPLFLHTLRACVPLCV